MTIRQIWLVAAALLGLVTRADAQVVLPGIIHHWPADGDAEDRAGDAHGVFHGEVDFGVGRFGGAIEFAGAGHVDFGVAIRASLSRAATGVAAGCCRDAVAHGGDQAAYPV